jgi:hypothetical protein
MLLARLLHDGLAFLRTIIEGLEEKALAPFLDDLYSDLFLRHSRKREIKNTVPRNFLA